MKRHHAPFAKQVLVQVQSLAPNPTGGRLDGQNRPLDKVRWQGRVQIAQHDVTSGKFGILSPGFLH